MRSNSKQAAKDLEKYRFELYIHKETSYKKLCKEYGLLLKRSSFHNKVLIYQEHGLAGIQLNMINNRYSKGFNHSVVLEHLEEAAIIKGLSRKYNIPSYTIVIFCLFTIYLRRVVRFYFNGAF